MSITKQWQERVDWIKGFGEVIYLLDELGCPAPSDQDPYKRPPREERLIYPEQCAMGVGASHLTWHDKDGKRLGFVSQNYWGIQQKSFNFTLAVPTRDAAQQTERVTNPTELRAVAERFVAGLKNLLA